MYVQQFNHHIMDHFYRIYLVHLRSHKRINGWKNSSLLDKCFCLIRFSLPLLFRICFSFLFMLLLLFNIFVVLSFALFMVPIVIFETKMLQDNEEKCFVYKVILISWLICASIQIHHTMSNGIYTLSFSPALYLMFIQIHTFIGPFSLDDFDI